jgi:hypothetical protein
VDARRDVSPLAPHVAGLRFLDKVCERMVYLDGIVRRPGLDAGRCGWGAVSEGEACGDELGGGPTADTEEETGVAPT